MKKSYWGFLSLLLVPGMLSTAPAVRFDDFFIDKTMRIDYYHIGNADKEMITLDRIYRYGIWAGSKKNLLDPFNQGRYSIKIYDAASNTLIYSRDFDSYFGEYKTSSPAIKGIQRTYHESAIIPCPKGKILFVLEKRDRQNQLAEFYRTEIDPDDVNIIVEGLTDQSIKVFKSLESGEAHRKVDIAMIGEGYTAAEEKKFTADLQRFTELLFHEEPYRSNKNKFNVYGVLKPSEESGVDEPRHGSFKNTALSASFNSLGSERYLLTEDNRALRDIAAHVPYDALYIMVNHHRYGGGGIYNLFCAFTTDNQWSEYLFVHEFGHSLLGLADEYYTSSTAYNDFYPRGIEPLEPNITALLEPQNLKWKHLVSEGTEIPTPWEKQQYEEMDLVWQKLRRELNDKIAELNRSGAPQEVVQKVQQEYNARDRKHAEKVNQFLSNSKYAGNVGAFEGAGYNSQGLYRPMVDCIMFSKAQKSFCKVCEEAITRVIQYYSE